MYPLSLRSAHRVNRLVPPPGNKSGRPAFRIIRQSVERCTERIPAGHLISLRRTRFFSLSLKLSQSWPKKASLKKFRPLTYPIARGPSGLAFHESGPLIRSFEFHCETAALLTPTKRATFDCGVPFWSNCIPYFRRNSKRCTSIFLTSLKVC